MGLVKLQNRRNNGARLKLDVADWLKIMLTITVLIFGAGKLMSNVSANTKTIGEHIQKFSIIEKDLSIIKSDVSFIRGQLTK